MADISKLLELIQQNAYLQAGGGRKTTAEDVASLFSGIGTGLESAGKGLSSGAEAVNNSRKANYEESKALQEIFKNQREITPKYSRFDLGDVPRETPEQTDLALKQMFDADYDSPDARIAALDEGIKRKQEQLSMEQKPELTIKEYVDIKKAERDNDLTGRIATSTDEALSGGMIKAGTWTNNSAVKMAALQRRKETKPPSGGSRGDKTVTALNKIIDAYNRKSLFERTDEDTQLYNAAINELKKIGGIKGGTAVPPPDESVSELPAKALTTLKIAGGKSVTFANGQTWKWDGAKAVRLK